MTTKRLITSVDDLIAAFGGPTELGSLLNIGQPAVSKWSMSGHIPRGWHLILDRMASARGMHVHDSVWGLEGFDPFADGPVLRRTDERVGVEPAA